MMITTSVTLLNERANFYNCKYQNCGTQKSRSRNSSDKRVKSMSMTILVQCSCSIYLLYFLILVDIYIINKIEICLKLEIL